jgi:hypothetical protein
MEYKVTNPLTGKKVNALGPVGREVYRNYLNKRIVIDDEDLIILRKFHGKKVKDMSPSPGVAENKRVEITELHKDKKIDYIVFNTGYSKNLTENHKDELMRESGYLQMIMSYDKKNKIKNYSKTDMAFALELHKSMMRIENKTYRPTDYALIRVKGRRKRYALHVMDMIFQSWANGADAFCPFLDPYCITKTFILELNSKKNVLVVFFDDVNKL